MIKAKEHFITNVIKEICEIKDWSEAEALKIVDDHMETVNGCFDREMSEEQCANLILFGHD